MKLSVISSLLALFLAGCTSQPDFAAKPAPELYLEKPSADLVLEPVEFTIIIHDNVPYYALTDENYINLSINMLRLQHVLYSFAVWEKLRDAGNTGTKATEDDRGEATEASVTDGAGW